MVWRSVCCALQGRGHAKNNIPCQDKVAKREANGVHVIVLADGAGSAKFSHFGAECIVNGTADFIIDNFFHLISQEDGRNVTRELFSAAMDLLEREAKYRNCTTKDLASTLLIAAVSEENFFLAHLGDGVIGYLNDTGLKTVSTPDNGEFVNETVFLTSANASSHMRIYKGKLKNISGFVLMSDGTEYSLYDKRSKKLIPAVKRLMHHTCLIDEKILMPQLEDALKTVVVTNTQDDCSIALLARVSDQLPPIDKLPLSERQVLFEPYGNTSLPKIRRKISWFDKICKLLKNPMTLSQLSRRLHLKKRYALKKIQRLLKTGLVIKKNCFFETYCR